MRNLKIENLLITVGMMITSFGIVQLGNNVSEARQSTLVRVVSIAQHARAKAKSTYQHSAKATHRQAYRYLTNYKLAKIEGRFKSK